MHIIHEHYHTLVRLLLAPTVGLDGRLLCPAAVDAAAARTTTEPPSPRPGGTDMIYFDCIRNNARSISSGVTGKVNTAANGKRLRNCSNLSVNSDG